MSEALIILRGITADAPKKAALLGYLRGHLSCDVFLPALCQWMGVRFAAWQLERFLKRAIIPRGYEQVHFLCYISGGFILRCMLTRWPFDRWGRIVWVRSPIQEQVPGRLIRKRGRMPVALAVGKVAFDLTADWRNRLPYPETGKEQGLILERGVSRMAAELGLKAGDFDGLLEEGGYKLTAAAETLQVKEGHDEVYASESVLAEVVAFITTGRFRNVTETTSRT